MLLEASNSRSESKSTLTLTRSARVPVERMLNSTPKIGWKPPRQLVKASSDWPAVQRSFWLRSSFDSMRVRTASERSVPAAVSRAVVESGARGRVGSGIVTCAAATTGNAANTTRNVMVEKRTKTLVDVYKLGRRLRRSPIGAGRARDLEMPRCPVEYTGRPIAYNPVQIEEFRLSVRPRRHA